MSNEEVDPAAELIQAKEARCPGGAKVEILTAREVPLGGLRSMTVFRTLPQKQRSLIGAWCFVDHYGPDRVSDSGGMDVAPHPHTGLQTVSWLFEGKVMHHDSAGNHAVVKPGHVNLMTAGNGICHSEVSTQDTTVLHGVQLWVALPDKDRHTAPGFDHYEPPLTALDGATARVFVGSLFGEESPVPTYTPLVGAEVVLEEGALLEIELDPKFEHGYLLDAGALEIEGVRVSERELAYTGVGEERVRVRNTGEGPARFMLLGGEPFGEDIVMWWNFIGRSSEELEAFRNEWQAGEGGENERFGAVEGYISHEPGGHTWIPAPTFPPVALKARKHPEPVARLLA